VNRTFESHSALRLPILLAGYAAVLFAAFYLAYDLRFDFAVPVEFQADRNHYAPLVVLVQLGLLVLFRQFGSLLTYFSVPDLLRIVTSLSASNVLLAVVWYASAGRIAPPRGVILADFVFAVAGLCCFRLALRMYRERFTMVRGEDGEIIKRRRIVILGAGDVGARLAQEATSRPRLGLKPVCFLDDDVTKHGRQVHGVTVRGLPEDLVRIAADEKLDGVVVAMPSASGKRMRDLVQLAAEAKLKVETVPSFSELTSGRVQVSRIRPVDVEDLLGREQVELDSTGIKNSVQGRVVLVTGAGGSIGSELCRQIAALAPKRLLLVEQAEGSLFIIEQELNELGLGTVAVPLVGDILDEERMRFIFSHYQPQLVFHAAAHKHVYLMERQPAEAIRNNVLGTRLLATIAADYGVEAFVLISTDKAINPTNVMGATKRLAEIQMMAIAAAGRSEGDRSQETGDRGQRTEAGGQESGSEAEVVAAETHLTAEKIMAAVSNTGGSVAAEETGDRRQESGDRTQEPGDRSQESGDRSQRPGARTATAQPRAIGFHAPEPATARAVPHSPAISEPLAALPRHSWARRRPTKFMAVRFGNVLGSSGSVIPIFKRQIANGGPVTVTHPDVTRYFMTIPEAVGLVLQASILGQGGEIFVLDMGQPVKIVDLAKQMIDLSGFKVGDDIEIKFTGLKPGEKLYEELQHKTEQYTATEHTRIMRFTPTAMFSESGVQELQQRLYELDSNALKGLLKRLVPEYTPFLD
jgi:FlaA1/EpsC-like NDP-sugar epimerase